MRRPFIEYKGQFIKRARGISARVSMKVAGKEMFVSHRFRVGCEDNELELKNIMIKGLSAHTRMKL